MDVVSVSERRAALANALAQSRVAGDCFGSRLGILEERLHALDAHARPVTVRVHRFRRGHVNSVATLQAAQKFLDSCAVPRMVEPLLKEGVKDNLTSYLESLAELQGSIGYFESHPGFKHGEEVLSKCRGLHKEGISKLQVYFSAELQNHSKDMDPAAMFDALPKLKKGETEVVRETRNEAVSDPKSTVAEGSPDTDGAGEAKVAESNKASAVLPQDVINNLHLTATKVISSGAVQECTLIYRKSRREWVEKMLKRLAVEELSKDEILRMPWENLEEKIASWIQQMRVTMMVLFVEERKLSDAVFDGQDPHREKVFNEVIGKSVDILLAFGDAVSECQKTPEKLFVLLDIYEALNNLTPQVERIFAGKASQAIRERFGCLLQKIATGVRLTVTELENAVEKDAHKVTVLDGTVHPLTSYVVNYVKFLFDYEGTLTVLFKEENKAAVSEHGTEESPSLLAGTTRKILSILVTNLEGKSKAYKDAALGHVFLMNNVHYMVRAVKKSDVASSMLGNEWLEKHRRIVQQNASNYQRLAWTKILGLIATQGLPAESSAAVKTIKERFKAFYVAFEETHSKQCTWSIPDESLRDAVCLALGEVLLPAYGAFIRRCTPILESNSKTIDKYIKYTPGQLESMLQELFTGSTAPSSR